MLQTSWGFATLPFDLWGKPHDHLETRVVGGAILTNVKPREANKNQAISQPFRFPGQYEDEETGLYYNRYRYYMPNEGMYTQRDPIGLAGGNPTVYGYVKNTLSELDPFGLKPLFDINLGNGFFGRLDVFKTNGILDFEIHVYAKGGREVGVFGSEGWFNKHGIKAVDVNVPQGVENKLKGIAINYMRKIGILRPKGTQDITGDKCKRPRAGACEK